MSVLSNIGLVAAERLEHSMGAAVALRSYKALLGDDDLRVVARATAGAIRCALEIGDRLELEQIAAFWQTQADAPDAGVVATCIGLARGRPADALLLARAEAERSPSPRRWYLVGRLCEQHGQRADAIAAYARAGLAGPEAVTVACRRLALLIDEGDEAGMLELAQALESADLTPEQRLLVARARLKAASKFVRASALSELEVLAASEPEVRDAAVVLAASHADDLGGALSWVEGERIEAALAHWPDEIERRAAASGIAVLRAVAAQGEDEAADSLRESMRGSAGAGRYLDLARALSVGTPIAVAELEQDDDPTVAFAASGLNAVAWLLEGDSQAAVGALERAAARAGGRLPVPASVWTATLLGLRCDTPEARAAARALCELLLARHLGIPPRGFSPYAAALFASGAGEVGIAALRAAALHREPGAAEALTSELARRGWQAYQAGEHDQARRLLREARGLARSTPDRASA